MTVRSILLHVDARETMAKRLQACLSLAERLDAKVKVLYAPKLISYIGMGDSVAAASALAETIDTQKNEAEQIRNVVTEESKAYSMAIDFAFVGGEPGEQIADAARYCDLLVIGQPNADDPLAISRQRLEHAIIAAGRPALVIPYIGAPDEFGGRTLVAWNGTREAARAVKDALPMLFTSTQVDLLGIVDPEDLPRAKQGLESLASYLALHGVQCEVHAEVHGSSDPGEFLLSRLSDFSSDMLVMGAYGHSPMREMLLGGVTRTLLTEMTVPVLMAH